MRIVKATSADNNRLCDFYNFAILPGEVDLRIERQDFFAPYRLQSDDYSTYMLINEKEEIEATASLIFKRGWLGNQEELIGYATDLRVSNSRRAILNWAQHFMPILESEKNSRQCRYVFTVVAQMQKQAYNAFIRPRLTRRNLPRYHLFRSFRMVSIHGLLPFANKPLSTIFLREGTDSDWDEIYTYLSRKRKSSVLHFSGTPERTAENLRRWSGLQAKDFILAYDFHRRLIGCVGLWDSNQVQKAYAVNYHRRARVLHDSLNAMTFLGFTKHLASAGEPLKYYHLTHFCADNPDVFYSLLLAAYQMDRERFVIYPHFDGDISFTPPRMMISSNLRAGLYCIQDPQQLTPEFLAWSRLAIPPEYELPFL